MADLQRKAGRSSLIHMRAVIEAPYYESEFFCPWEIPEFEPFEKIRLHGEMTYPEIGLFFAQLAKYNQIELVDDKQIVLKQILEAKELILPGGIQVVSEEKNIYPGCCCGLETWREWIDFLKIGESPWLGHAPSPWVEIQGNVVRIWSDGGIEQVSNAFHIDVSRSHFEEALTFVEQDLQAFLVGIKGWAKRIGFAEPSKLFQKFDECFHIGRDYRAISVKDPACY